MWFIERLRYNKPSGKIVSKKINKMYFYKNSLIKWLRNNKDVPYKKKLYQKKYKEIKSDVKEFKLLGKNM